MSKITVITPGEECRHSFAQVGGCRGHYNRQYLSADFRCEVCGKRRSFAVAMTGFWLANARSEGGSYV